MIVSGRVIKGDGIARKLFGTPTANLVFSVAPDIAPGVYAARAVIDGMRYGAAVCVGADGKEKFEVHVLDFDNDILGTTIDIDVLDRVSDLVPWVSEDQMRKKILEDLAAVREILRHKRREGVQRGRVLHHDASLQITEFSSLRPPRPHRYYDISAVGLGVQERTAIISYVRFGKGTVLGDHYHTGSGGTSSRSPEVLFVIHGTALLIATPVQHPTRRVKARSAVGIPVGEPQRHMLQAGMLVHISAFVHHQLEIRTDEAFVYVEFLCRQEDVIHDDTFLLESTEH